MSCSTRSVILEIKAEAIIDPAKRDNAMRELAALDVVLRREVASASELEALDAELQAVNCALWRTEDDIRAVGRAGQFDDRFIERARGVYRNNDRRAVLKRRINELTGSDIVEGKSVV